MKLEAEDILEEIADDLIVYLKAGNININSFIDKLNLDINNMQQLLRIHFIMSDEVISFIRSLPENLRRIKTSTRKTTEVLNGKIKGRIDWQDTFRERYRTNYLDRTKYSCIQRDKNFNIKENLVLKRLLEVIIKILKEDIDLNKNYKWLNDWNDGNKLFSRFTHIYSRNIYLNKIDTDNVVITDRMVNDTMKSRNRLYRKAAWLLALYRKLTKPAYWQNENIRNTIKELLRNTFVRPESENVLFELYWAFNLLQSYEGARYNVIDGKKNIVAFWEDSRYTYELYHDSEGSGEISFRVELSEIRDSQNDYLQRMYRSRKDFINMSHEIFGKEKSLAFWKGRPDIILEKRNKETNKLEEIYIGEVKNTTNKEYAMEGLKELLEYMSLVKESGRYFNNVELSDSRVKGYLCLNDVKVNIDVVKNVQVLCGKK